MSSKKELYFFGAEGQGDRCETLAAYEALFAAVDGESAIGEATPTYLYSTRAAAEIRELIPHARLIVSLRQPADRAFSGYAWRRRAGKETRLGTDAFQADAPYVRLGFYYKHIERYLDLFQREQILVVLLDELAAEPAATCKTIFEFLDIDSTFRVQQLQPRGLRPRVPRLPRLGHFVRKSRLGRELYRALPLGLQDLGKAHLLQPPPTLTKELRAQLTALYRDDILRTSELIGRDLSHWLET